LVRLGSATQDSPASPLRTARPPFRLRSAPPRCARRSAPLVRLGSATQDSPASPLRTARPPFRLRSAPPRCARRSAPLARLASARDMETLRFTRPELDGVHLHAELRGDPRSPTVVLLHGGGANLHWWDEIAPSLAERFRVVCLDFRGHGDSDHPEALVVGAFHRDLEALVAELGQEDIALVGHSMGGHVALDHAARHPRTWGLVAIDVSFGAA